MKFLTVALFTAATLAAPSFQNISGGSTVLARRGNSNGRGDNGGQVVDQSTNDALTAHGDSLFSGNNNKFESITSTFGGAAKDLLVRRGIIQGLGIIGANGNNNEDSSKSQNVISGGDQQLSGKSIDNSPKSTIGDTINSFDVNA